MHGRLALAVSRHRLGFPTQNTALFLIPSRSSSGVIFALLQGMWARSEAVKKDRWLVAPVRHEQEVWSSIEPLVDRPVRLGMRVWKRQCLHCGEGDRVCARSREGRRPRRKGGRVCARRSLRRKATAFAPGVEGGRWPGGRPQSLRLAGPELFAPLSVTPLWVPGGWSDWSVELGAARRANATGRRRGERPGESDSQQGPAQDHHRGREVDDETRHVDQGGNKRGRGARGI